MAVKIGTAYVEVRADLSGLNRQVNQAAAGMQARFSKAAKHMAAGVVAGAAGFAAFDKFIEFGRASIETASDINESLTKNQRLFGAYAREVEAFSRSSASSFGISRRAALEYTGVFGNLSRALGIGQRQSAGMSVRLTRLAADLASFNNTSIDDALEALRSGLVGEQEPLRRYGVSLSQVAVQAEAVRDGIVKVSRSSLEYRTAAMAVTAAEHAQADAISRHGRRSLEAHRATIQLENAQARLVKVARGGNATLSAQQRSLATVAVIMRQTRQAQGDFGRTSRGLANQQRILSARLSDVSATIGNALLPVALKAVTGLNGLITSASHGAGVFGDLGDTFSSIATTGRGLYTTLGPIAAGIAGITFHILGAGLAFSQTRVGMALLGAAAGALLGRMVALGAAFAIGKVMSFISGIRDMISTFGVLRAVYIAQTGVTNASTAAVIRFAVAQRIAAGASRGMAAAMASTGFGAFIVLAGTVIGALAGINAGNRKTTVSAKQLTDAMRDQADALRAVRDIDLDAARARTRLRQANLTVEVTERRLQRLRAQGKQGTAQYKQTEIDLENARQEQRQATRDLGDVEARAESKRREASARAREQISTGTRRIDTLRGEIKALNEDLAVETRRSRGIRGAGLNEKNRAKAQADAARTAAQLAAKQRELDATMGRVAGIRRQADLVNRLRDRLDNLRTGTNAYRRTNDRLVAATQGLINRLDDVRPATSRAGRGFDNLGVNVQGLGASMAGVTSFTKDATNRLLTAFGARPVRLTLRPPTGNQRFMAALGLQRGGHLEGGAPSGDSIPILGERGEYMLNRRAVHAMGGPEVLDRINFGMAPRFERRQEGGAIGGVNPAVSSLAGQLQRMFGLTVTSTTGGRHAPNSYHYRGMAADLAGPSDAMDRAAAWIISSGTFRSLLEGIHNPNLSVKDGAVVSPSVYAGVWDEHRNHIHIALSGLARQIASKIARLTVRGGTGPMNAIVSGAAERLRGVANRYLAAHMGGGGDNADFMSGPGKIVGASTFGGPHDPGTGHTGYMGDVLDGQMAYAELNMGHALGGLPYRKMLGISAGSRSVSASKLDIGAGGAPVDGHSTDIDLWVDTAHALGLPDVWKGLVKLTGLQRGGLVGMQSGGDPFAVTAGARRGRRKRGERLGPLDHAISRALGVVAHGKRKRRSLVLHRLLRRISGIGVDRRLFASIAGFDHLQQLYGERADLASQLTTQDANGNDIPGVFAGMGEADWLRLQLDQLFQWRNAMLRARQMVQRALGRALKVIEHARRRLHEIAQKIIEQGRIKADLQKALDNLDHDPRGARRRLEGQLARLKRHPSRNRAEIESVQRQLDALDGDRNTRRRSLRTRIGEIARAQSARVRQRTNLRDRILPSLTKRRDAMRDDLSTYGDNLSTVQGMGDGYPYDAVLPTLPDLTSSSALGGSIFSVQLRLRDLGAPRSAISDSTGGGGDGSGGDSERADLEHDLRVRAQQAAFVANQQFAVLRQIPFAGIFHSGGMVPGPLGQEALALVQGGETITPIGGGERTLRVIHEDRRTRYVLDGQEVRAIVRDETRQMVRGARNAGRAGSLVR